MAIFDFFCKIGTILIWALAAKWNKKSGARVRKYACAQ